jgi:glycine/D-amino acid oxidase-like deaminating enzyme
MTDPAATIHRNFWLDEALALETLTGDAPPLAGDRRADVVIVGGGYTGLWTAIDLKTREPSLDVVLIERDICGWGASGRNAGYLINLWAKFATMKRRFGRERAIAIGRAVDQGIEELIAFCDANAIDAEIRRQGWLVAATLPRHDGRWPAMIDDLAGDQIAPYEQLSGAEIESRWGLTGIVSGLLDRTAGHLQPAKLVRGLRRVALARGVTIHEHTGLTRLERRRPPVVHTERGAITADRVVIAMNAWAARLPELRRLIMVTGYANAVTAPMPERLRETGFADGPCFNDSYNLINCLRPTASGRVLFGKPGSALALAGHVGAEFEDDTARLLDLERRRVELDPILPGLDAAYAWSGPIDRSRDGLPVFGPLPGSPDIFHATGFSGDGVGPCRLAGKVLASLVLETPDDLTCLGLVRPPDPEFPVEPVRWIGTGLVRRAIRKIDRAERTGKRAGPLTRKLGGLVAAGVADTMSAAPDA